MAKSGSKKTATDQGSSGEAATRTTPTTTQWPAKRRAAAVDKNLGKSQSLRDFLSGAGWR